MKKNVFTRAFVLIAFGVAMMALVLGSEGLGGAENEIGYRVLSDAMTLPAVVLIAFGVIVLASRNGAFDIFSYAFTRLAGILAPLGGRSNERFYDYRLRKKRAEISSGTVPLFVGGGFLFLALVFLFLFYSA